MRSSLILLAVLAAVPLPVLAAKPTTVEQLQKTLAAAQATHQSDKDTVRQLADLELTSQLRPEALKQLIAASPGPKTTQALRGLADISAFLEPPVGELPASPAPDFATQKAILGKTIHYVARVLPTMPDFLATRTTEHFDDSPQAFQTGGWPVRAGLHLDGTFESSITVMDGEEKAVPNLVTASQAKLKKVNSASNSSTPAKLGSGLNSWGEFRTIMGIVLVDAAKGKLNWARWERIETDEGTIAAVFQFQTDRSASHYDVRFSRNRPSHGSVKPVSNYDFRQISGYHGHIAIDPVTGAVLRVQIDADMEPGSPVQRASMLVNYGPVKLGPRTYICPVHSIAVSTSDEVYQPTSKSPFVDLNELQINETVFSNYQRFGSDSTILTSSHAISEKLAEAANAPPSPVASSSGSFAAPGSATSQLAENAPPPEPTPTPDPATSASSEAISAAEVESDQEILIHAIDSMPGEDSNSDDTSDQNPSGGKPQSPTFKSTTHLVDVGLLAFDKHGKPITNLKPEDIEIYDNGRRQQLSSFHHTEPAASVPQSGPPLPDSIDTFTNAVTVKHVGQDAPDLLLILLDEAHLPWQDLNRAREDVLHFLKATRPDSRLALYAINEHGFRVIQDVTQDHALVAKKLAAWTPSAQAVSMAQADDQRLRQQFDTVHNPSDLNSVNGNYTETPDSVTTIDPALRQLGQNPLRESLNSMIALARHFGSVPGHKCMAWISGDSALGYWEDRSVATEKSPNTAAASLQYAKEALNEARIALYIVDASQLGTNAVDPSLANQYIKLTPAAQDNAALGLYNSGVSQTQSRIDSTGRATAQMQTDLHGIQGPVRDLAESTGGQAFRRAGGIENTLNGILADTDTLYEIGFDPDTPADGKFHTLVLKIPARKDVKLRYRSSYLYSEESSTIKERFQQAIWSPQDSGDLSLTAQAVPPAGATGEGIVKLRIAFPGLALQQQQGERPDRWTDQLYIFVAVRDDAAQQAEVSGDTLRLSLKQASYESGMPAGIPYQRAVETKSRLGSVRVIVVDGNSGKMGSVTIPSSALHPQK